VFGRHLLEGGLELVDQLDKVLCQEVVLFDDGPFGIAHGFSCGSNVDGGMTRDQWEALPLYSPSTVEDLLAAAAEGDQFRVGVVDAPVLVTVVANSNPSSPYSPLSVKIETLEFE
jgi:hypothetical protein